MSQLKNSKNITVLNSANMPSDGTYNKRSISKNEFIGLIQQAETIKSGIGYSSVSELIKDLTNIQIDVNREIVFIDDESTIVGLTLGYRLNPNNKGHINPTADDYIYFIAEYKK